MKSGVYDPTEYVKGLQQILISDKKKIGFLFGAGTSLHAKKGESSITIPAIADMTRKVVEEIGSEKASYKTALDEIKNELTEACFNIELILSNLESKQQVIGKGRLNSLDKQGFIDLINMLKNKIMHEVCCHKLLEPEDYEDLVHSDFAKWIGRANRKYPVEIFTTNYDYLFELGLEHNDIPYYDGFTGSYCPFFYAASIEDFSFLARQTKLWKIHGSLGWHYDKATGKIIRKGSDKKDILIYPSILKYDESKKQPYTSFMDRLCNFLRQDDSILVTCGYSFCDEHINERIKTALDTDATSHVIALYCDGDFENADWNNSLLHKMACSNSKISVYGLRSAVIGCKRGKWKLRTEPDKEDTININLYFDEDAPINETDKKNEEKKGEEIWTGEGEFRLPEFYNLVAFLEAMIIGNEINESVIDEKS
jgi:hypothetical protein